MASLGILFLAARLARMLNGSVLLALFLTATNAYLVTHSREARSYMVGAFFSFWALVEAVDVARTSSRGSWVRYGIALLCTCYVHYVQAVFGIASALTLLFLKPSRRTFSGIAIIVAVGAAAFLPWFSFLRAQLFHASFYASVWTGENIGSMADGVYYMHRLVAWALLYNIPPRAFQALYPWFPMIVILSAGVLYRSAREDVGMRAAVVMLGLVLAQAGVYWVLRAVGEPVYLLAFFPLLLTLYAVALSRWWRIEKIGRSVAVSVTIILVFLAGGGINEMWSNRFHLEDRLTRDPWPLYRSYIAAHANDNDALVVIPGWPSPGGWYFRDHPALFQIYLSTDYFRRVAPYERITVGAPLPLADSIAAGYDRIWLLRFRPGHYPYETTFVERLSRGRTIKPVGMFGRMTATRLEQARL